MRIFAWLPFFINYRRSFYGRPSLFWFHSVCCCAVLWYAALCCCRVVCYWVNSVRKAGNDDDDGGDGSADTATALDRWELQFDSIRACTFVRSIQPNIQSRACVCHFARTHICYRAAVFSVCMTARAQCRHKRDFIQVFGAANAWFLSHIALYWSRNECEWSAFSESSSNVCIQNLNKQVLKRAIHCLYTKYSNERFWWKTK